MQFGGGIFDKRRACIEDVPLWGFRQPGKLEVVAKQQAWLGLWDLPPGETCGECRDWRSCVSHELNLHGKGAPCLAARAILMFMAVRAPLLVMY